MIARSRPHTQQVSWKRVGLCLLAIFAALYLLVAAVDHIFVWHLARSEAAEANHITPQPLTNQNADPLNDGETIDCFGYSLRVPWKIATHTEAKTVATFQFVNGASISLADMRGDTLGPGLLENANAKEVARLKVMYGSKTLSSRYEFLRAELTTSPDEVSFWHSNLSTAGTLTLLMERQGLLQRANKVYTIATPHLRGFQINHANAATIHLIVFDAKDRELWVLCHPPTNSTMTQSQINGMLASIDPIS